MKKKLFSIFLLFLLTFSVVAIGVNAQTTNNPTLDGLKDTANTVDAFRGQTNDNDQTSQAFIQTRAGIVVGAVLSFVGILFLILVVFAGIKWMTANGNPEEVKKARDLIINSIIGIVIVFAAYAITTFIGSEILK